MRRIIIAPGLVHTWSNEFPSLSEMQEFLPPGKPARGRNDTTKNPTDKGPEVVLGPD